ncbi:MAG TPA: hypothetical protein VMZ50_06935 [Phycisphaerae bacterium]|nr:hypothetical protein [Phycisphaerae bacterium]HUX16880.1 hypothetical protein [Phycisphaerae bacterium]
MTRLTKRIAREVATPSGPAVVSLVPQANGGCRIEVRRKRGRRRWTIGFPDLLGVCRDHGELTAWVRRPRQVNGEPR